jgi:hypothetical protein
VSIFETEILEKIIGDVHIYHNLHTNQCILSEHKIHGQLLRTAINESGGCASDYKTTKQ